MPNPVLYSIILGCIIVQAIAAWAIARNNQAEKDADRKKNATSGKLSPEIESRSTEYPGEGGKEFFPHAPEENPGAGDFLELEPQHEDRYNLWVGTVGGGWSRQDLESEFPIMRLINVQGKSPINVRLNENKFIVEGKFYDLDNRIVAELKNGEWTYNPSTAWKRNYDDHAFEVIDNSGMVVLKVYFKDTRTIQLECVIVTPQYVLVATSDGLHTIPNLNGLVKEQEAFWGRRGMDWKDFIREKAAIIEPMFMYEGDNWLGKRRVSQNS